MHPMLEMINSPERLCLRPRTLNFGSSPENLGNFSFESVNLSATPRRLPVSSPASPPYRKVGQLRLYDTPSTPKTIMQKSSKRASMTKNVFKKGLDSTYSTCANVNPFTPDSLRMNNYKKRCRTDSQHENLSSSTLNKSLRRRSVAAFTINCEIEEDDQPHQAPKRIALQETNISRYHREFVELSLIGTGVFGEVYKCLNRLDGCEYAVKKSKKPVAGSISEQTALNEVWAHAVLGKHDNVVRYYSAWAEDNHMLIQNEYCDGGSLQTVLESRYLEESELRILLTHIAGGLKYIHSHRLCHMDIKSGNIFLSKVPKLDNLENGGDLVIYKIGDLGHVTSVTDPHVEEGDCRYLPLEVLHENFDNLYEADMFALGMTLYEAAGGGPLPKNGVLWHKLREGNVPNLPCLSKGFFNLIKLLMDPNPKKRPSSTSIFQHPVLCPSEIKSHRQLTYELIMERKKNEELLIQLSEINIRLNAHKDGTTPKNRKVESSTLIASDRKLRSYTRKPLLRSSSTEQAHLEYLR